MLAREMRVRAWGILRFGLGYGKPDPSVKRKALASHGFQATGIAEVGYRESRSKRRIRPEVWREVAWSCDGVQATERPEVVNRES